MKEQSKKFNYIREWPVSFTSFFPLIFRGKCKLKYIEIVAPFLKTRSMYVLTHRVFTFSKPLFKLTFYLSETPQKYFFSPSVYFTSTFFPSTSALTYLIFCTLFYLLFLSITYGKVDTFQAALEVKQQTTGQQDYQFCFLASWSRH